MEAAILNVSFSSPWPFSERSKLEDLQQPELQTRLSLMSFANMFLFF